MTTEIVRLFATDENIGVLRGLLQQLPSRPTQDSEKPSPTLHLRQIVQVMVNNAQRFDELCQVNIKWIGSSFISAARNFESHGERTEDSIADLFTMAYRFLCELEFGMPGELSMELRQVKSFVDNNLDVFPDNSKRQLVYANYLMPVNMAKEMLHHPDISAMREFGERCASATTLKKQWDEEISQKEVQVKALKEQLGNLETGFNFVGLVEGFRHLAEKKRQEKLVAFNSLIALGILVLLPVLAEAVLIGLNRDALDKYQQALLFALPPLITIEVLLVYFFRVVLVHFRSIKAQLLQLELRTSLCQFIQSYSTYATQIKQKDASALEKFESVIFSGLISSEEHLPSTFDGTEQLAKLIKSIKGSP
jgi:hypothetical protein